MNPSEPKTESKEKNIEVIFKMKFIKENEEIYQVYELSNNRLAVELENSLKIYSLENFKLITEINNEQIHKSLELKNKDIAISNYDVITFYKLSDNNYISYQKITEKEKIFEIYELKNENLIVCIRHKLNIYSKNKGKYKLLSKIELCETVGNILEIKNNILFLFLQSRCRSYTSANYSPYVLQLLNLEKNQEIEVSDGRFTRKDDKTIFQGCNSIIKKNKYLLTRYAGSFDIYIIENNNIKLIYTINTKKDIKDFPIDFEYLCDYDDDNFIILPSKDIYKYDEKLNKIIFIKKFEIGIEKITDVNKLNNNKLVAHNYKELLIIKS